MNVAFVTGTIDIYKEDSFSSSKVVNCVGAISEAGVEVFHYYVQHCSGRLT